MITKIIILILTFGAAVIMAFEKVIKNEKKASKFEYTIFFILLISSGFTAYQIWDENDRDTKKEKTEIALQDSLRLKIQRGIDSGINANNQLLAEAFRRQNINFDSLKFAINKNVSNKTEIKIPEVVPDLEFSTYNGIKYIGKKGNSYEFELAFSCQESKAKNIEIKIFPVIKWSNGKYEKIKDSYLFADGTTDLSKDIETKSTIGFTSDSRDSIEILFLVAKGKYWNSSLSQSYPFYSIRKLDMSNKIYSGLPPGSYPNVWKLFEPR
jgi:hypothetical protein